MSEYDGWTIKSFMGRNPWLLINFTRLTRKEAIENYEGIFGSGCWKERRDGGHLKLVKVKLVEAE